MALRPSDYSTDPLGRQIEPSEERLCDCRHCLTSLVIRKLLEYNSLMDLQVWPESGALSGRGEKDPWSLNLPVMFEAKRGSGVGI
jgi:hypothetical protein